MTKTETVESQVEQHSSDNGRTGEFIMPQGKVKWFNNAKGYGFIIEDGCTDDLFAHFSSVQMDGYKTLKAGQPVTFEKKPSDKGVHAVNIVPQEMPQRQEKPSGTEAESHEHHPQEQQRAVNG